MDRSDKGFLYGNILRLAPLTDLSGCGIRKGDTADDLVLRRQTCNDLRQYRGLTCTGRRKQNHILVRIQDRFDHTVLVFVELDLGERRFFRKRCMQITAGAALYIRFTERVVGTERTGASALDLLLRGLDKDRETARKVLFQNLRRKVFFTAVDRMQVAVRFRFDRELRLSCSRPLVLAEKMQKVYGGFPVKKMHDQSFRTVVYVSLGRSRKRRDTRAVVVIDDIVNMIVKTQGRDRDRLLLISLGFIADHLITEGRVATLQQIPVRPKKDVSRALTALVLVTARVETGGEHFAHIHPRIEVLTVKVCVQHILEDIPQHHAIGQCIAHLICPYRCIGRACFSLYVGVKPDRTLLFLSSTHKNSS